jgi:hypothetical protein
MKLFPTINSPKDLHGDGLSIAFLLLLPFSLFLMNRNLFFMNSIEGAIDPWGYLGYFIDLPGHVSHLNGGYPASRLGWTLLGGLIYALFPPIVANIMLRLLLYYGCLISLYVLLKALFRKQGLALSVSVYFCTQLPIWFSLGRDYTDGGCIFYTFISLLFIYCSYRFSTKSFIFLIAAGISTSFLIATHFFTIVLLSPILLWLLFVKFYVFSGQNRRSIIRDFLSFFLGLGLGLLGISLISFDLGGHFLFLSSSIAFAKGFGNYGNQPWLHICQYQIYDYWISALIPGAVTSLLSIAVSLQQYKPLKNHWGEVIRASFLSINYLLILAFFLIYELLGGCILRTYFAMLVPFAVLAIAEFIHGCDRYFNRRTYTTLIVLCLAQAFMALMVVRFVAMSQLDDTGVEDQFNTFFVYSRITIVILFSLAVLAYLISRLRSSRFFRTTSFTLLFTALILMPWPAFNYDGLISHSIFSNIQQYRSVYEVLNYLSANQALQNSIFWYDAQSPIGSHYRSVASTTFISRNLVNEYYPYLDDLKDTVTAQQNTLKLISSQDDLDAFTENYNMKVVDANGALSPQVEITPGKRIVIFSDFNSETPETALARHGIEFQSLNHKTFQLGTFKFNVAIGDVPLQKKSQDDIFSCTIHRAYNPLKTASPYSFRTNEKNCIQSSVFDKILKYDVLVTQKIPVSPKSRYLVSLSSSRHALNAKNPSSLLPPLRNPNRSTLALQPHDLNTLGFELMNPDLALFDMTYCPKKPLDVAKQFVFNSESAQQVILSVTAPLACGSELTNPDRLDESLELRISKLPPLPAQTPIEPVYLSQNMPHDWWRVRYKKVIIVPKKVEYNEFHQAFEIITNKASGEEFQLASPLIQLQKDFKYVVNFNYKVIEGGFNIFALAEDSKTKLGNLSFCKTSTSPPLISQTFEFQSSTFKTARIVLSREPKCFDTPLGQSHFFIEGVRLGRQEIAE